MKLKVKNPIRLVYVGLLVSIIVYLYFFKGWQFIFEPSIPNLGKITPPKENSAQQKETVEQKNDPSPPDNKDTPIRGEIKIWDTMRKMRQLPSTLDEQEYYRKIMGLHVVDEGFITNRYWIGSNYGVRIDETLNQNSQSFSCEFDKSWREVELLDLPYKTKFSGTVSGGLILPNVTLSNCELIK